jgi:hypothetical protein
MSVWESTEDLKEFAYRNAHAGIMRARNKWFVKHTATTLSLWWISENHTPTPQEAKLRLESINKIGSTLFAFTFNDVFLPTV